MQKIFAKFKLVTPLFMSGADQTKFELRAESFKGMLRFWWRALAYSRFDGNLEDIHAAESSLFGSSDTGQGSFRLRVYEENKERTKWRVQNKNEMLMPNGQLAGKEGMLYLGHGVVHPANNNRTGAVRGQLIRPCLLSPADITMELLFKKNPDQTIINALKLFGLLGGIGSRSRRGYGCLSLESIDNWQAPASLETYRETISSLLGTPGIGKPSYSAFSSMTRIACVNRGENPFHILNDIGLKMQKYRSYGRANPHKGNRYEVNRQPAEQNFRDDHDLMLKVACGKTPATHPKRVVFGLPQNYFFSTPNPNRIHQKPGVKPEKQTRRASPLMIHIHRLSEYSFIGVLSIIPADFLPSDAKILISNNVSCLTDGGSTVEVKVDFNALNRFIDGREGVDPEKTGSFYFPARQNIFPIPK